MAAILSLNSKWNIENSKKLYRIEGWGEPYFDINQEGNVTVSPEGNLDSCLDLHHLVEELKQRDIQLPLLIRFSDILADRISRINICFAQAIARYQYPNIYRGVYPIKCNQHRQVLESLISYGKSYQFGLEVGSKPELMIALGVFKSLDGALIIANGYKDREYLETALLATKLGYQVLIVIEQLEELKLVTEISDKLGIAPKLGIRAKLTTRGSGHWGDSTGDRAKFGLTIPQILTVINTLTQAKKLNCLQLLHFHIGSQIPAISVIKDAIREASQIYVELVKLGANMQYLDVGGGLGIDYDGSKTSFSASKNYTMQNYANDIVAEVKEACEQGKISAPILISESGRAIASHQSVLIFDVLSTSEAATELPTPTAERENLIIRNLWETYETINTNNYQEAYHDAIQFKEEAISLFNFGYLSLTQRAQAEQLYWACCQRISEILDTQEYMPDDLKNLKKTMTSIYYINLSVFQSAPDTWAIDQLFPIMPIHRLGEQPTRRGILADITCDSDGKIDKFIDLNNIKPWLELHPLQVDTKTQHHQPYYLGMFLVGAYQEIMGNLHNLFGDINVVHIQMTPQGYEIEHVVKGDTISEVLKAVEYKPEDLLESMRRHTETALAQKRITLAESQRLLQNYEHSLRSYTYLSTH